MCTLSVSNVIYHKFSHGAAFYTLNGKNVNVMLEYDVILSRVPAGKAQLNGPNGVLLCCHNGKGFPATL